MKKNKLKLFVLAIWLGSAILISCTEDELLIALDEIELSDSALLLAVAETQLVTVKVAPVNAAGEVVTWTSNDPSIAVVQSNDAGLVTAIQGVALGIATITGKNNDGSVMKSVDVEVIVKVESIALEEVPLADMSETSYSILYTPENTTKKTSVWSSSNPSIATVDENGKVTAVASGENGAPVQVVITATSEEGEKTASVELTISSDPPIIGILYCTTSGTGGYNAETVTTAGADANISYAGAQPAGNYEHYEGETIIAQPGGSFELSLAQSNTWSRSIVWIDWNGDNDFEDDGEFVAALGLGNQSNDGPFNVQVNVAAVTEPGLIRMRVLTGDAWSYADIPTSPCGEMANSTTKDFNIEIGGTAYCSVSGTGAYNADAVTTTGGDTNIDYTGAQPSGNYEFYTSGILGVQSGGSFNLSVTNSNGWSRSLVWIDWNADGDFNDDGEILSPLSIEAFYSGDDAIAYNIDVDVPAGLTSGIVRMRILTGDAWSYDNASIPASPCAELGNSTTKDFSIKIL